MFSRYLPSTATLQKITSFNNYGEPVYGTLVSIKCRKEPCEELVYAPNGSLQKVSSMYVTNALIAVGDKLDGRSVIKVEAPSTLSGQVPLYWSYLL